MLTRRAAAVGLALFAFALVFCSHGLAAEADADVDCIRVPCQNGHLAYADLAAALAKIDGLDVSALMTGVPQRGLSVDSAAAKVGLRLLNVAMQPVARCRVVDEGGDGGGQHLEIAVDRAALRAKEAQLRAASLKLLGDAGVRQKQVYGLSLEPGAAESPTERPLVVLVHGFNSTPERCGRLLTVAHDLELPAAAFHYPNDQPLADSAKLLASELRKLKRDQPSRRVVLLTYSMGGLVARAVVEDPKLDSGTIARLMMVAPPSHGAPFARYAVGLDVWEHLVTRRGDWQDKLYGALADGFGEAAEDLQPDSKFLKRLNRRPRNPNVRYTILLGNGGELDSTPLAAAQAARAAIADGPGWSKRFAGVVDSMERDLADALANGDGVVPLESGRLAGVEDTVVLGFSHFSVLDRPTHPATLALDRELGQRLAGE